VTIALILIAVWLGMLALFVALRLHATKRHTANVALQPRASALAKSMTAPCQSVVTAGSRSLAAATGSAALSEASLTARRSVG
jgi:hypothetical protein